MPLKEQQVSSYSELTNLLANTQGEGEEIFLFFSCTLDKHGDPTTKICFEAEDVLMEYTEYIRNSKRQLHLFYYRVLLEEYSKAGCEVGKDRNLRITSIPTLLKWKSYQRLSGLQCCKFSLLSMVFEVECQTKFPVYQPCTFFKPKEKVEVVQTEEESQPEGEDRPSKGSLNNKETSDKPPEGNVKSSDGEVKAPEAQVKPPQGDVNTPQADVKPPPADVKQKSGGDEQRKTSSAPKSATENSTEAGPVAVRDGAPDI